MRLKKKTKRRLRSVVVILLVAMLLLPVFTNVLLQNTQGTDQQIDPRLMEEMLKAQEEPAEGYPVPNIEGSYQVTEIVDGNTIKVLWGDEERTVTLIGIDPVETSKRALKSLIKNEIVHLEFESEDTESQDTLKAYVYHGDGTFINRALLLAGDARLNENEENRKYIEELSTAQDAAKSGGAGCWAAGEEVK